MSIQNAALGASSITTDQPGGSSAPAPHAPELVQGTFVDLAGVTRAKNVPARRREVFAKNGLGAPKVWVVFNADNNFAENDTFNVTGDLRLRLDTSALRHLDEHIVWGPTNLANQDGTPSKYDPRTTLAIAERRAEEAGYSAQFGFEFEFLLLPESIADERRPDIFATPWLGYGAQPFIEQDDFFADLTVAADAAGIELEQLHTEWGTRQYEVSVAPDTPVAAADKAVLFKLLVKRTAARHGLKAIFSPKPFPDQAGSGGHIHFSLTKLATGTHLFSGGDGVYGLTAEGGHAIAGVQAHLAELTAILSGSPVSLLRLQPDTWSGAAIGWGLENREVAIRYAAATLGNPRGANIEIKTGDAAANPYLALAGLLSAALDGIAQSHRCSIRPRASRRRSPMRKSASAGWFRSRTTSMRSPACSASPRPRGAGTAMASSTRSSRSATWSGKPTATPPRRTSPTCSATYGDGRPGRGAKPSWSPSSVRNTIETSCALISCGTATLRGSSPAISIPMPS